MADPTPGATQRLSPTARRAAVEAAIREHGWDHGLALRLADETGWAWRTIYRDRDDVIAKLAEEETADLPRRRAAFLQDVRSLRAEARRAKSFASATKLLTMEAQILGLDRAPLPTVDEESETLDTSLEGVLRETRRLYLRAMAGDSFVAADRLLERMQEIILAIQRRDEEDQRKQRGSMDEDALVELIERSAARLPDTLRRRLVAVLGG